MAMVVSPSDGGTFPDTLKLSFPKSVDLHVDWVLSELIHAS